jgi:hypothetical protein
VATESEHFFSTLSDLVDEIEGAWEERGHRADNADDFEAFQEALRGWKAVEDAIP